MAIFKQVIPCNMEETTKGHILQVQYRCELRNAKAGNCNVENPWNCIMKAFPHFLVSIFSVIMLFAYSTAIYADAKPSNKTITLKMGTVKNIHPILDVGLENDSKAHIAETSFYTTDESVAFAVLHLEGDPTVQSPFKGQVYYELNPLKTGTTFITVKVLDRNGTWYLASYTVNVIDVTSISIPSTLTLTEGEEYKFEPFVIDSRFDDPTLTWKSSDANVATVTNDKYELNGYYWTKVVEGGIVTAHKAGTSIIACSYKNIMATCQLTVNPIYVSYITFNNVPESIDEFESLKVEAIISPANASNKSLSWRSSNTDVATVDGSGNVTALKSGQTVIIATAKDGSGISGNYVLTVKSKNIEKNKVDFCIDDYAQVSTEVAKDKPISIKVIPPAEMWSIKTLTENGTNILNKLTEDGVYTIDKVDEPKIINVTFAYNGSIQFIDFTTSGVSSILTGSDIKVTRKDSDIQLTNLVEGNKIKIYSINGTLIAEHVATSNSLSISVPSGIYIIFVETLHFKVKI